MLFVIKDSIFQNTKVWSSHVNMQHTGSMKNPSYRYNYVTLLQYLHFILYMDKKIHQIWYKYTP